MEKAYFHKIKMPSAPEDEGEDQVRLPTLSPEWWAHTPSPADDDDQVGAGDSALRAVGRAAVAVAPPAAKGGAPKAGETGLGGETRGSRCCARRGG
mmetsp:Transcript_28696/g.72666  ORF Transcript_28696/g.72666 Transcript_28696/m.72666 type:complete len:96 (-) Transcript_28696:1510-1797(-)